VLDVRILVALLASLNSPFKGNWLLLRDCTNEIMGSGLLDLGMTITQLTCGDVMHVLLVRVSGN
jgi:hypothetical protein